MLGAILRALRLAMRRELGSFRTLKVNNFFLFIALLVAGAVSSGVPPWSAYPFFALMGLPLLFPLSSDPMEKIPAERLKLWPLESRHRMGLRLASLVLSPLFWLLLVFGIRGGGVLPGVFLTVAALARIPLPAGAGSRGAGRAGAEHADAVIVRAR